MPVQVFNPGQVLTAAELTTLVNMLLYPTSATANLNPCVAGNLYYCSGGGALVMTLPAPGTAGQVIGFKLRATTGSVQINRNSTEVIYGPGYPGVTSITITSPEALVVLVSDGTNWHVAGTSLSVTSGDGNNVATLQSTVSTSYTDLGTTGPTITLQTNTKAQITVTAQLFNTSAGAASYMGVAVSGATTIAANDTQAMIFISPAGSQSALISATFPITGLTPGANTFTAKYKAGSGTAEFQARGISGLALAA